VPSSRLDYTVATGRVAAVIGSGGDLLGVARQFNTHCRSPSLSLLLLRR